MEHEPIRNPDILREVIQSHLRQMTFFAIEGVKAWGQYDESLGAYVLRYGRNRYSVKNVTPHIMEVTERILSRRGEQLPETIRPDFLSLWIRESDLATVSPPNASFDLTYGLVVGNNGFVTAGYQANLGRTVATLEGVWVSGEEMGPDHYFPGAINYEMTVLWMMQRMAEAAYRAPYVAGPEAPQSLVIKI